VPDEQGYLSFDEVRQMLGVTEPHLHNLVRANELRAFRVEGEMKFKRPDVEKLLVDGFAEADAAEEAAATAVSPEDETMALLEPVDGDDFLVEEEERDELDLSLSEEPEEASRPPLILVSGEEAGEEAAAPDTESLPQEEPETVRIEEAEPAAEVAAEPERDETASELDFTDEVGFDILEDVEESGGGAPSSASVVVEEEAAEEEDEEIELVPQTEEELWADKYAPVTMTVAQEEPDKLTPIILVVTALVALYPLLLYIHLAGTPMVETETRNGQEVARETMPGYLDVFRQNLGADGWMGRRQPGGR
jgi:excisionase family DNA binding protein